MNWKEYEFSAERTLSTEFHSGQKVELLLHAIVGILTEVEELIDNHMGDPDEINRTEELFDIFWYFSIITRQYNIDVPKNIKSSISDPFQMILNAIKVSLKALDLLKKKLYYNKDLDDELFIRYSNEIISMFVLYADVYNVDIQDGLNRNILKLKSRYPEKFTSERAINRNLVAERKILEG